MVMLMLMVVVVVKVKVMVMVMVMMTCVNIMETLVDVTQDRDYLYMVMELAHGGELLRLIRRCAAEHEQSGTLDTACHIDTTRFYVGEIVLALEVSHDESWCFVGRGSYFVFGTV